MLGKRHKPNIIAVANIGFVALHNSNHQGISIMVQIITSSTIIKIEIVNFFFIERYIDL